MIVLLAPSLCGWAGGLDVILDLVMWARMHVGCLCFACLRHHIDQLRLTPAQGVRVIRADVRSCVRLGGRDEHQSTSSTCLAHSKFVCSNRFAEPCCFSQSAAASSLKSVYINLCIPTDSLSLSTSVGHVHFACLSLAVSLSALGCFKVFVSACLFANLRQLASNLSICDTVCFGLTDLCACWQMVVFQSVYVFLVCVCWSPCLLARLFAWQVVGKSGCVGQCFWLVSSQKVSSLHVLGCVRHAARHKGHNRCMALLFGSKSKRKHVLVLCTKRCDLFANLPWLATIYLALSAGKGLIGQCSCPQAYA